MTRRLVVSYVTIAVIVLLLLELPLAVFYQQRELDRLTVDLERDATVLATIYEDALEKGEPTDPASASSYAADTGARVVIVDDAGISVIDTEREPSRDFSTRPEFEQALLGERSAGTRRSDTLDVELLFVAVPVASGGNVHGALRLTFDSHEVTERVWKFWAGLVAVGLVIVAVMAVVGWFIARSVTRPVHRLRSKAARFSSGDLTPSPVDRSAPTELAELEASMNDMAVRLDELIERQQSFVADASHQLRTPLTALRLRLENLAAGHDIPHEQAEFHEAIDETTRLSTLVDDLLQLARTEKPPDPTDIELGRLVADRVDTWTARAEQDDVHLELHTPPTPVRARAIDGGVEQVLDNVLDNAVRAAPSGSTVTVTIRAGAQVHTLTVADRGPGLSDDDKAQAMTRFWRSDDSIPGTGLGLAIVHRIVTWSGGTIALGDTDPSGLTVMVTLPTAPSPPAGRRDRRVSAARRGRVRVQ